MRQIKIFSAICFFGLTAIFTNSCSKSDDMGSSGGGLDPNAQNVSIQGMAFTPATVTVAIGTKIVWTNMDTDAHTVTSDDGTSFNSGNISSGGTFNFTPTQTGSFPYHCSIHPSMTGTVQVVIK